MPSNIFRYIFRHSLKQQIIVLVLTLVYMPILYFSFELPKIIVNDAIAPPAESFPRQLLGIAFEQVPYLLALCGILLALVVITGGMRYCLSVYKGVLGEIMLRRLRYDLYDRVLRFPLAHLRKVTGGEIVTMATAEVEPLGRYMGIAVANPALQLGTLLTALFFLFMQDVMLGLAAIALFPVQVYFVPKLQRRMNEVSRRRLRNVRLFAGHVTETIDGVRDIRAHDTRAFELSRASERLGVLFRIRRQLYKLGNTIIFLNSFFTQLTPFFFYSLGGYLVIMGDLTFGSLVAVIAAYRETATPWNELLENYQAAEDNRVKYAGLVENFRVAEDAAAADVEEDREVCGPLSAAGAGLEDGDLRLVEDATFEVPIPGRVAIVGPAGSGKNHLAQMLCGLRPPTAGTITLGGCDITRLSPAVIGRCLGYADSDSHVFSGTWRDNLYYGLKHRPVREPDYDAQTAEERKRWVREALAAGNATSDINADWIDYAAAGVAGPGDLSREAVRVLRLVGLSEDVYRLGLGRCIDPAAEPALAQGLLAARARFRERYAEAGLEGAVEFFDAGAFGDNATIGENLLFGRPRDETLDVHHMGGNAYVLEVLDEAGLLGRLLEIGHAIAATTVDLFGDVDADDEHLRRLSLIDADALPEYQALLRRVDKAACVRATGRDRTLLLALAFSLAPAHQRLGLVDDEVRGRVLAARRAFAAGLPAALLDKVEFFAPDAVNGGVTVQCNLLFGRIARGKGQHRGAVDTVVREILEETGLCDDIMALGLDADVGRSGALLSPAQRQKLALARALIKKPVLLIVNEALSAVDGDEQDRILDAVLAETAGRGLIWIDRERPGVEAFETVLVMAGGRIVEERGGARPAADGTRAGTNMEEVEVLGSMPLLKGLATATLKLLAYASPRQEFAAGEILFREGDDADGAYFIIDGEAEVSCGEGPGRRVLAVRGKGTVIGEIALLAGIPRTATVTARTALTVLCVTRDLFLDLVRRDADLGVAVMGELAARLAEATGSPTGAAADE